MKTQSSCLAVLAILSLAQSANAQSSALIPEFEVHDKNHNVIGPAHVTTTTVLVLIQDTANSDFFYLQFGKYWFRAADLDEMYFDNNDCTGDAYVVAPESNSGYAFLQSLRGSWYALGPTAAGGTSFGRIYRSAATTGSDNSTIIESKWEISNSKMAPAGAGGGPTCTPTGSISFPTVRANPVASLDAFVTTTIGNKPFHVH